VSLVPQAYLNHSGRQLSLAIPSGFSASLVCQTSAQLHLAVPSGFSASSVH